MNAPRVGRRALLATCALASLGRAMGRTPYGGTLRFGVPWPIARLDPHVVGDPLAALVGSALFEPLFALDRSGRPYPTLAARLPEPVAGGRVRVTLRPGLTSARGTSLNARDVAFSLARARDRGAAPLLGDLTSITPDKSDPWSILTAGVPAESLAERLASPLTALVPRGFSALEPDGAGPFRAELAPGRARFLRNTNAARGPAFLDAVELWTARELSELLRSFESGNADVGWFGRGLYGGVKDSVPFELAPYGLLVLVSGRATRGWGAPGVVQRLLETVPAQALGHLGVRRPRETAVGSPLWGGEPGEIAVERGQLQTIAVARSLAALMSSPGHELTVAERSAAEMEDLRASRGFFLMLDFVRPLLPGDRGLELALRLAANPEAARKPPRTAPQPPRDVARALPLGIVGELAFYGARRRELAAFEGGELGSVYFTPP